MVPVRRGPRLPLDPGEAVLDAGHGAHVEEVDVVDQRVWARPVFPPRLPDVKFDGGSVMGLAAGAAGGVLRRLEVGVHVAGERDLKK